jgi:hypothetical protein
MQLCDRLRTLRRFVSACVKLYTRKLGYVRAFVPACLPAVLIWRDGERIDLRSRETERHWQSDRHSETEGRKELRGLGGRTRITDGVVTGR